MLQTELKEYEKDVFLKQIADNMVEKMATNVYNRLKGNQKSMSQLSNGHLSLEDQFKLAKQS